MKSITPLIVACASFGLAQRMFFNMSLVATMHIMYRYDSNLKCSEFLFMKRSRLRVR